MGGVGHQHAIAAREREIGGQRRAFVAALFLHDLDEQHLATADDVLNLVPAPERHAALAQRVGSAVLVPATRPRRAARLIFGMLVIVVAIVAILLDMIARSEEHTSELQSLMRISYAVFCLTKNKGKNTSDNLLSTY